MQQIGQILAPLLPPLADVIEQGVAPSAESFDDVFGKGIVTLNPDLVSDHSASMVVPNAEPATIAKSQPTLEGKIAQKFVTEPTLLEPGRGRLVIQSASPIVDLGRSAKSNFTVPSVQTNSPATLVEGYRGTPSHADSYLEKMDGTISNTTGKQPKVVPEFAVERQVQNQTEVRAPKQPMWDERGAVVETVRSRETAAAKVFSAARAQSEGLVQPSAAPEAENPSKVTPALAKMSTSDPVLSAQAKTTPVNAKDLTVERELTSLGHSGSSDRVEPRGVANFERPRQPKFESNARPAIVVPANPRHLRNPLQGAEAVVESKMRHSRSDASITPAASAPGPKADPTVYIGSPRNSESPSSRETRFGSQSGVFGKQAANTMMTAVGDIPDPIEDPQLVDKAPSVGFETVPVVARTGSSGAVVVSAPAIIKQLATVAITGADGPVEVSLDPIELGKVKMMISQSDGTLSLLVMAERPETLDLLRRNLDMLDTELRESGYTEIDISFSDSGQNITRDDDENSPENITEDCQTDDARPGPRLGPDDAGLTDQLNLRL